MVDQGGWAGIVGFMLRAMRLRCPGAIYHMMGRGDRREGIFVDDMNQEELLKTLAAYRTPLAQRK